MTNVCSACTPHVCCTANFHDEIHTYFFLSLFPPRDFNILLVRIANLRLFDIFNEVSATFSDSNCTKRISDMRINIRYIFFRIATRIVEREKMVGPISSSRTIGQISTSECILSSRSNEIVTRCGVDSTRVVKVGSGSLRFLVTPRPASPRRPSRFFSALCSGLHSR